MNNTYAVIFKRVLDVFFLQKIFTELFLASEKVFPEVQKLVWVITGAGAIVCTFALSPCV